MVDPEINMPRLTVQDAEAIVREHFDIDGVATKLAGWDDQNFRVDCEDGATFVLKVSGAHKDPAVLAAYTAALDWLAERVNGIGIPRPIKGVNGRTETTIGHHGTVGTVRMLTFVQGMPLAKVTRPTESLLREVGASLGRVTVSLNGFSHPALRHSHAWDLSAAPDVITQRMTYVTDPKRAALLRRMASRATSAFMMGVSAARRGVIHGDGNDHNVLLSGSDAGASVAGIIDFGDLLESRVVFEVAIAATYAMLDREDVVRATTAVVSGFHTVYPLTVQEIELIHPCIVLRLCASVCHSAARSRTEPKDPYLTISEEPAWKLLAQMENVSSHALTTCLLDACAMDARERGAEAEGNIESLRARRAAHVGPSLSLSYQSPLHIVSGSMQYLYTETGGEYLDTVNNVCHVGHCHPRVVSAAREQLSILNTNTRYLHRLLGDYAERLCSLFPEPLDVCFLVCSGSEANDLALRLARTYTGAQHVVSLEGAYHGSLSSLIDISPYKHDGPGGNGAPAWVRVAMVPDTYRGAYRDEATAGSLYARDVQRCLDEIESSGGAPAAFFAESLPSCAGQIVFPPGYLAPAYEAVHRAGGLCVADEVQTGFGRVGNAFWGFELQGVVPDIVTLGKPIGNGHPMAAVITTREIAQAFHNGMEYFNTFGGNPVSCAVGLAVLDVIQDEQLQTHAVHVGSHLKNRLDGLRSSHRNVADVRGEGLFLGVELVLDAERQEPASHQTSVVVEHMKEHGVLASRDGRFNNVVKFKPPMCFTVDNAERYVETLAAALDVAFG